MTEIVRSLESTGDCAIMDTKLLIYGLFQKGRVLAQDGNTYPTAMADSKLGLNRLTVDMDGTVVQAGNQVGWAFRGFNPHRKKNKSYDPLFAHLVLCQNSAPLVHHCLGARIGHGTLLPLYIQFCKLFTVIVF